MPRFGVAGNPGKSRADLNRLSTIWVGFRILYSGLRIRGLG